MMKLFKKYNAALIFSALILLSALASSAKAQDQDQDQAQNQTQHIDIPENTLTLVDNFRVPSEHFTAKIRAKNRLGNEMLFDALVRERSNSIVIYREPPKTRGRSILFVGRNMWVYIPGTRRVLRISPQQQVMSGLSSADTARVVFSVDYKITGSRLDPENPDEILLDLEGVGEGAAYHRIELWVSKADYRPLRGNYYASPTRLTKVGYFENYQTIRGKEIATRYRIVDFLNDEGEAFIDYEEIKADETPENWFQPGYLKRLR